MSDTKIAVFRPGALGDMILATPVLDALIRAHGDAGARLDLHVFVTMPHGSVLRAGEAEWGRLTVRDFGDRACAWLFGGSGPAPEILEESVGGADAVIAWLNDPDGIFRARIESLGARRIVIHTARPPLAAPDGDSRSLGRPVHASEHLWRALLDISDAASPQAEAGGAPGALGRTRFPPSPPVPAPESPSLRVRGAELRAGMSRLAALFPEPFEGGLAAIHPGSGGAAKRAPPEIFAAVARAVAAFGLRPFLIQGPADAEAVEAVLSAAAGRVADRMERRRSGGWRESGSGGGGSGPAPTDKVAGVPGRDEEPIPKHPMRSLLIEDDRFPGRRLPDRLEVLGSGKGDGDASDRRMSLRAASGRLPVLADPPLRELAAILTGCDVYVGNDSGVTHLAAAMGIPTLAFFGPTDPAVWCPRGPAVRIVRFRSEADAVRILSGAASDAVPDADPAAASPPRGRPPDLPAPPPILDAILRAVEG